MGVDATLFVLGSHSMLGVGYVQHVFSLHRHDAFFEALARVPALRKWPRIQLPEGAHSTFSDGERPAKYKNSEAGYLDHDSYGGDLAAFPGATLATVAEHAQGFNRAVLDFVVEHFPTHDVVVFWH